MHRIGHRLLLIGRSTDESGRIGDESRRQGGDIAANQETRAMKQLARRASVALGALVLAIIVAAPAAAATPPTRTVSYPTGFFAPAGLACAFDVLGVPVSGFKATT